MNKKLLVAASVILPVLAGVPAMAAPGDIPTVDVSAAGALIPTAINSTITANVGWVFAGVVVIALFGWARNMAKSTASGH